MTCNTYNPKIGDGQAVYDIPSHTIYIYSPDLLYNRTLHHEKVHAKHHSYKLVRALFFRKIGFFLGITACIFIQFLTSLFVAAIASFVILVLSLLAVLLFYVIRGIPAIKIQYFEPFAPRGLAAVFSTAGFVFISYGGLLKVASIGQSAA